MVQHCASDISFMRNILTCSDREEQEYAITYSISGIISVILRWHHNGYRQSPEQMVGMVLNLMASSMIQIESD